MAIRQLRITKQITKRESQSLDLYLHEIATLPLLTPEQEVECAKRIHSTNPREAKTALEKLVKHNLRFVVSVAKQYQNQGLQLTDLIATGNHGLIKAAKRFDYTRGFKFISYGVWWVRQSIMQSLAECSRGVRVPLNRISILNKILKKRSEFEQIHYRRPTNEELAEGLELTPEEVSHTLQVSGKHMSIDTPFVQGEENTLLDVLVDKTESKPDDHIMYESLKEEIRLLIDDLDPRQENTIKAFFGVAGEQKMTLQEIGDKLGLTRERVRQIREQTLNLLRKKAHSTNLRSYLGR